MANTYSALKRVRQEARRTAVNRARRTQFRRQIRGFLHFSETTAKEHGIEPQQHQLLLAVHGLPEDVKPTIREIASRLFIQHLPRDKNVAGLRRNMRRYAMFESRGSFL